MNPGIQTTEAGILETAKIETGKNLKKVGGLILTPEIREVEAVAAETENLHKIEDNLKFAEFLLINPN
jgi:hypothetical protein